MFCTGTSFKFKCEERVKAQVMELANDAQYKEKVSPSLPPSLAPSERERERERLFRGRWKDVAVRVF